MIPFSPPYIDQAIVKEVNAALNSGWITTGPRTKKLEQKVADYVGVPKVLCLNSATAGMELMLRYFGIGPGDEVILPAYTYCATANVVRHTGAIPVMVDSNPSDFNLSINSIEQAITEKTKAIIAVDFAGLPCDYDEINDLVRRSSIQSLFKPSSENQEKLGRILVMSDAAHSFGGVYFGTQVGALCDVSVFSFHAVKNLTTAEGGAVCLNLPAAFNVEAVYKELNIFSLHGQSKDAYSKTQKGAWEYDVLFPGYKWNMTDILASIGLVEIDRYEDNLAKRKSIFDRYTEAFKAHEWAEIPTYETDTKISSYHLYPLRIKGVSKGQRDAIIQEIFEQDVAVNVHFKPLPLLTAYNKEYSMEKFPNAQQNWEREISLPVYYTLTDENVQKVIAAVISSVNKIRA